MRVRMLAGGITGTRTRNLRCARALRYQLRHDPVAGRAGPVTACPSPDLNRDALSGTATSRLRVCQFRQTGRDARRRAGFRAVTSRRSSVSALRTVPPGGGTLFYITPAHDPPVKALAVVRGVWATHPMAIVPIPGLEPGRPFGTLAPKTSASANFARRALQRPDSNRRPPGNEPGEPNCSTLRVADTGFEPVKAELPDLQSGPFGRSGNPPFPRRGHWCRRRVGVQGLVPGLAARCPARIVHYEVLKNLVHHVRVLLLRGASGT